MPQLSICIPTLDRASDLRNCFDALLLTQGLASVEILVVNNGTSETTRPIVEAYRDRLAVRYIHHEKPTVGEALNRAWREASAAWIAYIDDDSVVYPPWTQAILDKIPHLPETCFAMAGNVDRGPNPPALPDWCHPNVADAAYSNCNLGSEDRYLSFPDTPLGNNFVIRKSFLEAQGGFSPELRTHWENHIVWLGYWQGGTCFFNANMRVKHAPSSARLNKGWALNKHRVSGRNYQQMLGLLHRHPQCLPRYDLLIRLPRAYGKLLASWLVGNKRRVTVFQSLIAFEHGRIDQLRGKAPAPEYSTFGSK